MASIKPHPPTQIEQQGFNEQLSDAQAANIVYGLLSEAVYLLLCVDRGWTVGEWGQWVARALASQLFPDTQLSSEA